MPAGRRCPGRTVDAAGREVGCPVILKGRERYCPRHARTYEQRRGTPTQRGYGAGHRALRAAWQARIDAGEDVRCADGCGARIVGTDWHLGHTEDRSDYLGPQTVGCNTADGGRRAHR